MPKKTGHAQQTNQGRTADKITPKQVLQARVRKFCRGGTKLVWEYLYCKEQAQLLGAPNEHNTWDLDGPPETVKCSGISLPYQNVSDRFYFDDKIILQIQIWTSRELLKITDTDSSLSALPQTLEHPRSATMSHSVLETSASTTTTTPSGLPALPPLGPGQSNTLPLRPERSAPAVVHEAVPTQGEAMVSHCSSHLCDSLHSLQAPFRTTDNHHLKETLLVLLGCTCQRQPRACIWTTWSIGLRRGMI